MEQEGGGASVKKKKDANLSGTGKQQALCQSTDGHFAFTSPPPQPSMDGFGECLPASCVPIGPGSLEDGAWRFFAPLR